MHRPLLTELGKLSLVVAINRTLLTELKNAATVGFATSLATRAKARRYGRLRFRPTLGEATTTLPISGAEGKEGKKSQ